MLKVMLFGAGSTGKTRYELVKDDYNVVAFMDNDSSKWGSNIDGIPVMSPEECLSTITDYEKIFVTSTTGFQAITEQLLKLNVPQFKISTDLIVFEMEARKTFLKNFSKLADRFSPDAVCAEAGVFAGDFAKYINQFFPTRTLHLFDTFSGFDERDISAEKELSDSKQGDFEQSSEKVVMDKMKFPEKVILHKGYFPDTAQGIDDQFCFVNLDMDLYKPTYEGLKFFSPRMEHGGVILVHDFFTMRFYGVKKAVEDFMNETTKNLNYVPIGDGISIMIAGF